MENKTLKILLVSLTFLMLVGIASAAPTLTSVTLTVPAASGTVGGDAYVLNSTVVGADSTALYNVTFKALSADTANSSYVTIGSLTNQNLTGATQKDANLSTTFNSSGLEDATSYTFQVTIVETGNATNTVSDTSSSVTVDNFVPTAPSSIEPTTATKYDGGSVNIRINSTVTGAQTTGCTLTWTDSTPTGTRTETMTHSANLCYVSLEQVPDGTYTYFITATDGTNTSQTGNYDVIFNNVDASPTARAYVISNPTGGDNESSNNSGFLVFAAIAVGLGLWWFNKNK